MTGWKCSCNNSCKDFETLLWFLAQVEGEKGFTVVGHQLWQKRKSCRRASETESRTESDPQKHASLCCLNRWTKPSLYQAGTSPWAPNINNLPPCWDSHPLSRAKGRSARRTECFAFSHFLCSNVNKSVFFSCTSSSYLHLKRRTFYSTTLNWGLKFFYNMKNKFVIFLSCDRDQISLTDLYTIKHVHHCDKLCFIH